MTAMVPAQRDAAGVLESVIIKGDLAGLTSEQKVIYYNRVCESVGVNPLTRPFDYITLNNKLTLYARKDCTDQLRKIHNVSINIVARDRHEDVYVVTARASLPSGKVDEAIGAVNIAGLRGDALANAFMKAETKAKRRVTLSIIGLGMLDETEAEDIPPQQTAQVSAAVVPVLPAPTTVTDSQIKELRDAAAAKGYGEAAWTAWLVKRGLKSMAELTAEQHRELMESIPSWPVPKKNGAATAPAKQPAQPAGAGFEPAESARRDLVDSIGQRIAEAGDVTVLNEIQADMVRHHDALGGDYNQLLRQWDQRKAALAQAKRGKPKQAALPGQTAAEREPGMEG